MIHINVTVLSDGVRRDLFVAGGRVQMEPVEGAVTVSEGGYAIPGLVDAHAHLALHSPADPAASDEERVRASARAQLEAGVLLVREPGSPSRLSRDLGPDEDLPRIHTAGRFLAGPRRYFPGLAREVTPDELPAAVAEEVAWSRQWAKVIGDFFDADGRITPVFPVEALREAATTAHDAGGRITMHCMTPEAVARAIEAGFDAVEHGTNITADLVEGMAERGMTWVPTLTIADPVRQMMTDEPTDDTPRILRGLATQPEMVRLGADRGIRILAGTDAGMVPHGIVASEIRLLAAAGLTPRDAIAAGSWEARRYLGLPSIEDGAPADLVVYPDDPTEDLSVLAHPSLIMIAGRIVPR
jgi:imidazolonepropionase-like amidohydrolase